LKCGKPTKKRMSSCRTLSKDLIWVRDISLLVFINCVDETLRWYEQKPNIIQLSRDLIIL
jgi:hypothetical protein